MDIAPILQAIIGTLAVLMTAFVIPFIKSKTTAAKCQKILAWVDIAVAAAEQSLITGEEKKRYVLEFLEGKGFRVDTQEIDAMIEAAVFEVKKWFA